MKSFITKVRNAPYALLAALTVTVWADAAYAETQNIGGLASGIEKQIKNVGTLLLAGAFLVGVLFVVAGLMKLKQASDTQGQQVKYGEGLWRLVVGAGLVAVPTLTGVLTTSVFETSMGPNSGDAPF